MTNLLRMTESWQPDTPAEKFGYDLHENDEIVFEGKDEFMTDLLTRFALEEKVLGLYRFSSGKPKR